MPQELHAVSTGEALSASAGLIAEQVLKPLFMLLQQAANTSSDGQIQDRGTLKGQCSASQATGGLTRCWVPADGSHELHNSPFHAGMKVIALDFD